MDVEEMSVSIVVMRCDPPGSTPRPVHDSNDLLDSSVTLFAPINLPADVVSALRRLTVPDDFATDPHLSGHRRVVFTDGHYRMDGHVLRYDDRFGVFVERDGDG